MSPNLTVSFPVTRGTFRRHGYIQVANERVFLVDMSNLAN